MKLALAASALVAAASALLPATPVADAGVPQLGPAVSIVAPRRLPLPPRHLIIVCDVDNHHCPCTGEPQPWRIVCYRIPPWAPKVPVLTAAGDE